MPSFIEIGLVVPEKKIFEEFLPYMGMAAILVKRPGLFIYTLIPPSYRCFTENLAMIGQAVLEKKMFEYYDNIYVYIAPGWGQMSPLGPIFF